MYLGLSVHSQGLYGYPHVLESQDAVKSVAVFRVPSLISDESRAQSVNNSSFNGYSKFQKALHYPTSRSFERGK